MMDDYLIIIYSIVAMFWVTTGQGVTPDSEPSADPAARAADPMAGFARMMPGEWRVTAKSGKSMFHAWQWGPGEHSIRRMTDGSGANGSPWREVQVFYHHPGQKQVRLLVLSPFDRGVGEGSIRFEGDAADATLDLYQTRGRRKMGVRWAFEGPDRYRETLLEAVGTRGYMPFVEFEQIRSKPPATPRPRAVEGATRPSERLKVLEPLVGHTYEAAGVPLPMRTTFEWVPLADAIYGRVVSTGGNSPPRHLLDVYFYHHTGTGKLRCLSLSEQGGVYEGDVTALDDRALQFDLKGYEGDRVLPLSARLEFEKDGSLRHRVWSVTDGKRDLLLDARHREVEGKDPSP
ncbi:MAG: hypothetical protein U0835_17605 [Isosphaeraceae bacterium]